MTQLTNLCSTARDSGVVFREPVAPDLGEEEVTTGRFSATYLAWLLKVTGAASSATPPNQALRNKLVTEHSPPVTSLVYEMSAETLCHPWGNPLNGPLDEWLSGSSPCLCSDDLPPAGTIPFWL